MKFLSYKKTYSKIGSTFMMILRCIVLIFAFSIFTSVNNSESVFASEECTDTEFLREGSFNMYGFYQKNGTCGEMRNASGNGNTLLSYSAAGGIYEGSINMNAFQYYFDTDLVDYVLGDNRGFSSAGLLEYYNEEIVPYYNSLPSSSINRVINTVVAEQSAIAIIGDDHVDILGSMGDYLLVSTISAAEINWEYITYTSGDLPISLEGPIYFITFGNTYTSLNCLLVLVDIEFWDGYFNAGMDEVVASIDKIEVMDANNVHVEFSVTHNLLTQCTVEIEKIDLESEVIGSWYGGYADCNNGVLTFTNYDFEVNSGYTIAIYATIYSYGLSERVVEEFFVFELPQSTCDFGNIHTYSNITTCYTNQNNAAGANMQILGPNSINKMNLEFDVEGGRIYKVGNYRNISTNIPLLSDYEPDLAEKIGLTSDADIVDVIGKYNELHQDQGQYQYGETIFTLVVAKYNQLIFRPVIESADGVDVFYYDFSYDGSGGYGSSHTYNSIDPLLYITTSSPIRIIKYIDGTMEHLILLINKTSGMDSVCIDCGNANIEYNGSSGESLTIDLNDTSMQCIITVDSTPIKYIGNSYSECNIETLEFHYSDWFDNFGGIYYISALVIDANNVYVYKKFDVLIGSLSSGSSACDTGYNSLGSTEGGWEACYINNRNQSLLQFNDSGQYESIYVTMYGRIYGGVVGADAVRFNVNTNQVEYYSDDIQVLIDVFNMVVDTGFDKPTADYPSQSQIAVIFARYDLLRIDADYVVYHDGSTYSIYPYEISDSLLYSPVYMAWHDGALMIIIDIENYESPVHFEVDNLEFSNNKVDFDVIANDNIVADYMHYQAQIKNTSCPTIDTKGYNFQRSFSISCGSLKSGVTYTLSVTVTDSYNMKTTKEYSFVFPLTESIYSNDYENGEAIAQYVTSFPNEQLILEFGGRIYRVVYGSDAWNLMLGEFQPNIYKYLGLNDATWIHDLVAGYNALRVHGTEFTGGSSNVSVVIAKFTSLEMTLTSMYGNTYYSSFHNVNIIDGYVEQYFRAVTTETPIALNTHPISFIRYSYHENQQLVIVININAGNDAICVNCGEIEINNLNTDDDGVYFNLNLLTGSIDSCDISIFATSLSYQSSSCREISMISPNVFNSYNREAIMFITIIDDYGVYLYFTYEFWPSGSNAGVNTGINSYCASYYMIGISDSGFGGCYINTNSQAEALFGNEEFVSAGITLNGRIYHALLGEDAYYFKDVETYLDLYYFPENGNYIYFDNFAVIVAKYTDIYISLFDTDWPLGKVWYFNGTGISEMIMDDVMRPEQYSNIYFIEYLDDLNYVHLITIINSDLYGQDDNIKAEFTVENITSSTTGVEFDIIINSKINYDYVYYCAFVDSDDGTKEFCGEGYNKNIHVRISSASPIFSLDSIYTVEVDVVDSFGNSGMKLFAFTPERTTTYTIVQDPNDLANLVINISDDSLNGKNIYYYFSNEPLASIVVPSTELDGNTLDALFFSAEVTSRSAIISLPLGVTTYYVYILSYVDNSIAYSLGVVSEPLAYSFFNKNNSYISSESSNGEFLSTYFDNCGAYYTRFATIDNAFRDGNDIIFTLTEGYHTGSIIYVSDTSAEANFNISGVSISFVTDEFSSVSVINNQFVINAPGNTYIYILINQEFVYNPNSLYAGQIGPKDTYLIPTNACTSYTLTFVADQLYSSSTICMERWGPFEDTMPPTTNLFDIQSTNEHAKHWDGFGDIVYTNSGLVINYSFEDVSSLYMRIVLHDEHQSQLYACESNNVGKGRVLTGVCDFPLNVMGLADGTYLVNYNVYDASVAVNGYLSPFITVVFDTSAPILSLDPAYVVTTRTTRHSDILSAYVLGDNYEYSDMYYYTSPFNNILFDYRPFANFMGSIAAGLYEQYYLYVRLDNQYDYAGNRVGGTIVEYDSYQFTMTSSEPVIDEDKIDVSDSVVDNHVFSNAAIIRNGIKIKMTDVGMVTFHADVNLIIYDLDSGEMVFSKDIAISFPYGGERSYSLSSEILSRDNLGLILEIYDHTNDVYDNIHRVFIRLFVDREAPTVKIDGAVDNVLTTTSGSLVEAYVYDDVLEAILFEGNIYYYATPYDILPMHAFYAGYNADSDKLAHHAWSYSQYYLFVGVNFFNDMMGSPLSGDNIVCNDLDTCDFASEGIVYRFIIRVTDAVITNSIIDSPGNNNVDVENDNAIYTNNVIDVGISTLVQTYNLSYVNVGMSVVTTSFVATGVEDYFETSFDGDSEGSLYLRSLNAGTYYIYVIVTIYSPELPGEEYAYQFYYYLKVILDNEAPKLSLDSTNADAYELTANGGDLIELYYHDNEENDNLVFKYFASARQYNNIGKLDVSYFRSEQPMVMNVGKYYLYVLTRGEDLSGNTLSGGTLAVPYVGPKGEYDDGKWMVIEFIIYCSDENKNEDIDLITSNKETNSYGGSTYVVKDGSTNPDLIVVTVNNCTTKTCSIKNILTDSLTKGSIDEIYHAINNAQGVTTNLYGTQLFTTNNGNLYLPGIVMYTSDGTMAQIVDLMILNNTPVLTGGGNAGANLTVNKGEEILTNVGLSFRSVDGSPVSVDTLITFNGEKVKSIDTTKVGIYTITQIATDSMGRKNKVVREITVLDTLEVEEEVIEEEEIVEVVKEVVVTVPSSSSSETNSEVREEVRNELKQVELHIHEKVKFKGYSKKKMIKKNKKEQFNFKLFSKYFFKVYDG